MASTEFKIENGVFVAPKQIANDGLTVCTPECNMAIQPKMPFGNPKKKDGSIHKNYTFCGGNDYPMFYTSAAEMNIIDDWYWGND